MQPSPAPAKSNRTLIIIIVVVLGLMGLSALCCVGVVVFGVGAVADAEKSYYDECEGLGDMQACQQCCARHGHSGYVAGEIFNDDGKVCGCI